jgi:F0F1-type ATP synthase membrane subunit b/b'
LENDKNKLETDFNVDNSERREIFQNAKDLAESLIDEARVEMNLDRKRKKVNKKLGKSSKITLAWDLRDSDRGQKKIGNC